MFLNSSERLLQEGALQELIDLAEDSNSDVSDSPMQSKKIEYLSEWEEGAEP